jgi:Spy/CpxP family protein refolding chaperone
MPKITTPWILSGLLAAAPLSAGHHPARPGAPPDEAERLGALFEQRADRMADALELTEAQRATYERLREEGRTAVQAQVDRMREAGRALHELLEAESPDPAAVGAQAIELHRLRGETKRLREQLESDFRAILTDAQKLAFDAVKRTRPGGELRERFGRRFGGPPPEEG